jgi:hypothetical protein
LPRIGDDRSNWRHHHRDDAHRHRSRRREELHDGPCHHDQRDTRPHDREVQAAPVTVTHRFIAHPLSVRLIPHAVVHVDDAIGEAKFIQQFQVGRKTGGEPIRTAADNDRINKLVKLVD